MSDNANQIILPVTLDMNKIMSNALNQANVEQVLTESLTKAVVSCTQSFVNDFFGYNGEGKKAIQDHLKNSLKVDLSSVELPVYDAVMAEHARKTLQDCVQQQMLATFQDELASSKGADIPETISIQDFLQQLVNHHFQDYDQDNLSPWEVEVTEKGYPIEGFSVKVTKPGAYSRHTKEEVLHLYFSSAGKNKKEDIRLRLNHRHGYNPTSLYGIDLHIFLYYAKGVKFTGWQEAVDYIDLEYPEWVEE